MLSSYDVGETKKQLGSFDKLSVSLRMFVSEIIQSEPKISKYFDLHSLDAENID